MGGDDNTGFDGHAPAPQFTVYHDWDGSEQPSSTVLKAIAAFTDTPPTEIDPPLYDVVDPDALNLLFQPTMDKSTQRGEGYLTVPIAGCTVRLNADGKIEISQSAKQKD